MRFDDLYLPVIKDMVDGPRLNTKEDTGELPPHTDEFRSLLEDHFAVQCFLPTRTAALDGRYTEVWTQISNHAHDSEFPYLEANEFPNRRSYQQLKSGHNKPQSLKLLARQQAVFLRLRGEDISAFPELENVLRCSDGSLFYHSPNSVKASIFRINRTALIDAQDKIGVTNRVFSKAVFNESGGPQIFDDIKRCEQSNRYSVTLPKCRSIEKWIDDQLKNGGGYDDALFMIDSDAAIEPLRRNQGNIL